MPAKYRIAEVIALPDGRTRYICEYEREGQGTQRPTFDFPKGTAFDDAMTEMRKLVDEERLINESPRGAGIRRLKDHPMLGKEF